MRSNRKQRREGIAKPPDLEAVVVIKTTEIAPITDANQVGRVVVQRLVPQSNAGDCTSCKGLRLRNSIANSTFIYAKRGVVRYCKCRVCGHTWKIAPRERL